MSVFHYKGTGDLIKVGERVTVSSINHIDFIVNGYVTDETLKPQHRVDLIGQMQGGDPIQIYANIELVEKK